MKILKIRTVYGDTYFVRDEDYSRAKRRSHVKTCKRDGSYHAERKDAPPRFLHKDNITQTTVLETLH